MTLSTTWMLLGLISYMEFIPKGSFPAFDTDEIVARYNSRDLGTIGWRKVRLEIREAEKVKKVLIVNNFWRRTSQEVQTLFYLESPAPLKGTSYLLSENRTPSDDGMRINLYLPAGKRRVLQIPPSNFDFGLLGSDFSYRDMRMLLPTKGVKYEQMESSMIGGTKTLVLHATTAFECRHIYILNEIQLIVGVDHFLHGHCPSDGNKASRLTKKMRVSKYKQIGDHWTATEITMHRGNRFNSRLSLIDIELERQDINDQIFLPASLPTLDSKLNH